MDGYVFVAKLGTSIVQKPAGTVAQLVEMGRTYSDSGWDCYFALASYKSGCGNRQGVNAEYVQAFWQDIDAGKPNSKYRDDREALLALVQFITKTKLTPTYIVRSGKGIHVYWCLDRPVKPDVWKVAAKRFEAVCDALGLDIDKHRSKDLSSVLRIPGTKHQKSGNLVTIASHSTAWGTAEFIQVLAKCPHGTTAPASVSAPQSSMRINGMDIPLNFMGMDLVQRSVKALVKSCVQFRNAFNGSYPVWLAAINLCKHCYDGERAAHRLSALYPQYDRDETQRVFDSVNANPALCVSLAADKPEACLGCALYGRGGSPIRFACKPIEDHVPETEPTPQQTITTHIYDQLFTVAKAAPVAIDHSDYWIRDDGTWCVVRLGEGKEVQTKLFDEKIYYLYTTVGYTVLAENSGTEVRVPERIYHYQVVYANGRKDILSLTAQTLTKIDALNVVLRNYMIIPPVFVKGAIVMGFFNAYIHMLKNKNSIKEIPKYDQLGWNEYTLPDTGDKVQGFVLADKIITAYGLHPCCLTEKAAHIAKSHVGSQGTIERWKEGIELFTSLDQPVVKFMLGLSLAAPLMKFMSAMVRNAIFSLYSPQSGLGKSTVLQVCASVWGNPDRDVVFFTRKESLPARNARLGVIQNIPACMDELTNLPDSVMTDIAFSLCNGKEKNKLRSSGDDFVKTGNWNTITYVTANTSMKAAVSRDSHGTDATMYRVIEYLCDFVDISDDYEKMDKVKRAVDLLMENYGLVGPDFIHQLLKTPSRISTFSDKLARWVNEHHFLQAERFISYPCAASLMALRWAKEYGYFDFNVDDIEKWVLNVLIPQNRIETEAYKEMGIVTFGDFLNANLDAVLTVKRAERFPEEKDTNNEALIDQYIIRRPRSQVIARFEQENHKFYISIGAFNRWCVRRGYDTRNMLDCFRSEGITINQLKYTLTKNVKSYPSSQTRCYEMRGGPLESLIMPPDPAELQRAAAEPPKTDPTQTLKELNFN